MQIALSNGDGTFTAVSWLNWGAGSNTYRSQGDFNGDGKTDLYRQDINSGSNANSLIQWRWHIHGRELAQLGRGLKYLSIAGRL